MQYRNQIWAIDLNGGARLVSKFMAPDNLCYKDIWTE